MTTIRSLAHGCGALWSRAAALMTVAAIALLANASAAIAQQSYQTPEEAAAALVSRLSGVSYNWSDSTIICAGGLNGILNVLLALLEDGDEVVMTDPIYIGLINRVRLAGGVPVFVPYKRDSGIWKLDCDQLDNAITPRTKVFLMMSPSMPTGAVFSRRDWGFICDACCRVDAWLLYDSAMERILYDGLEYVHPASFSGMAERTITVGSV